jgi:prepilin-type N-terminal cleavage/methylation domain-containing protein
MVERKAFTMIELVFVIIIISIVVYYFTHSNNKFSIQSVDKPKVDIHNVSVLSNNVKAVISDFEAYKIINSGIPDWSNILWKDITNIKLHKSPIDNTDAYETKAFNTVYLFSNDNINCFNFKVSKNGQLLIMNGKDYRNTICKYAKKNLNHFVQTHILDSVILPKTQSSKK